MNNYIVSGHSAIGKSHEDSGIKCQDSCCLKNDDTIVVAAVADGVSSSKHSDIASQKASKFVVDFLFDHINKKDSTEKILAVIKKGFDEALFRIKQISNGALNDFDTTLTVAVLIEDNLYYGQIGDSGIVALLEDGRFERVTEAQNGDGIGKDRPVYPLAAVSKWCFNKYEHKVKALFLATDGVLKNIQPPLLENGQKYNLNHKYLFYVFKNINLQKKNEDANLWIRKEVENMPPTEVDYDDKTLAVIINKKVRGKLLPREYYEFPTSELWETLRTEVDKKLYPYKYENKNASTKHIVVKQDVGKTELKQNDSIQAEEQEKIAALMTGDDKSEHSKAQAATPKTIITKSKAKKINFAPIDYIGIGFIAGVLFTSVAFIIVMKLFFLK